MYGQDWYKEEKARTRRKRQRSRRRCGAASRLVAGLLLGLPFAGTVLLASRVAAQAASAQTAISDTVLTAQGTPAQGTLLISWPSFTAASGAAVQTGSASVALGSNGSLSVSLVPNAGSTPIGSFYTVVYHLSDGTVTREYWQVPVSASAVTLSAVRTGVLPATVAVQTVSKQYVDQAIARAQLSGTSSGSTGSGSAYVLKTGDTMTGALVLPGDPATPLQAADKNYVDTSTASLQAGLDQKVSKIPTSTQVVTQPASTELRANRLNGELHAQEFLSPANNDGIANALAAPECTGGCTVVLDPDYGGTDSTVPTQTAAHLRDERGGRTVDTYSSPASGGQDVAETVTARFTESNPGSSLFGIARRISHTGYTGGNNLFPENYGFTLPYFKSTYSATDTEYKQFTQGQHVMDAHQVDCFGVGDCIFGSYYMRASGGFRDAADEGSHPADLELTEDQRVFTGVCSGGCTAGSQTLQVTATQSAGTQGSGRFLIDKAAGKTISTGTLVGGNPGAFPAATAQFSGTSFGASTFFFTAAAIPPQSTIMAPGTVTVAIQTTGLPSGFSSSTAASPASSGTACIADSISGGSATPENYEMAPFSVTDGTHLQLTLNKPHGPQAIVAIGGLCGYGLEQTVDTTGGIRQVFPVIGTVDATDLYVASGLTSIVGRNQSTSNYLNLSYTVTGVARASGLVTVTVSAPSALDTTGLTMTLSGVADSSFNGSFPVTLTAGNQFQFTQSGPDATSSGGTLAVLTGGYVLYPMAEVLDVYDPATGDVTGKFTLAPNTVAWAANDPVEEPHYFQQKVSADVEYITQYTPRPFNAQQAGIYYQGNNGPGLTGFVVANTAGGYLGSGGTRQAPDTALQTTGTWTTSLDMQAGEQTAIRLRCNSRGCGRFDSTYNLFQLDTVSGGASYDKVTYAPQSGTMQWTLHGAQYTMTPTAMTVGTLNVTNLNATHISGVSGASPATSSSQGTVQLGPAATSSTLANVATSGLASDLGGTLNVTQTAALTGDVTKAAGSGVTAVKSATDTFVTRGGTAGLADYPTSAQASQDPAVWVSRSFLDSNIVTASHAFAHGYADNNVFNRSATNCDTLNGFALGTAAAGSGASPGCAYASFDARTSYQGSNNFNHYVGYQSGGELNAAYTGTVNQWAGFLSVPKINGGTATNVIGFRATNPAKTGSGAVGTAIGVYVDAQTAGSAANYGIYVEQSANGNELDGLLNSSQTVAGQGGAYLHNLSTGSTSWTGMQLESETTNSTNRLVAGVFGPHFGAVSVLNPSSAYLASGSALTNGFLYNTETNAPHKWAVNSTVLMALTASQFGLASSLPFGWTTGSPAAALDTQISRPSAGTISFDTSTKGNAQAALLAGSATLGGTSQINAVYAGQAGLFVRNTSTNNSAWTGVQIEANNATQRAVWGTFGGNWTTVGVLLPNMVYYGCGSSQSNGCFYNTETNAPQRWAINSNVGMTLDGSRLSLSSGWVFHAALATPASSSAACTAGDFMDDANYHYVCVSANTWKRAALSAF